MLHDPALECLADRWRNAAPFQEAKDHVDVCDEAGIARPVVLGHSMEAPTVLLHGARAPRRAAGLVVQSGFAR